MAVTILEKPSKVSLTGNPVVFQFLVTNPNDLNYFRLVVGCRIWNGTDYDILKPDAIAPDEDGICTWNVQDLLRKRLQGKFTYPESKYNSIIEHSDLSNHFIITHQTRGFEADNREDLTVQIQVLDKNYFIEGGQPDIITQLQTEIDSEWYNELLIDKKFLTNQPAEKDIHPLQPEKLFWLVREGCTSLKINLKVNLLDGSQQNITGDTSSVSEFNICEITAGIQHYVEDPNAIANYKIWLTDQGNNIVSEIRTYRLDHKWYERNDFLLFRNSLCGYDTLWLRGKRSAEISGDRDHYNTKLPNIRPRLADRGFKSTRALTEKEFESNTGYITEEYANYLQELMNSDDVVYLNGDQALPVKHVSEEINPEDDSNETRPMTSLDINWKLGATRYFGLFNKSIPCPLPPYWNDLEACFFRISAKKLIDIKSGKHATIKSDGTIDFPQLTNDVFNKNNETWWETTLDPGTDPLYNWDPSDFTGSDLVLESKPAVRDILFWKNPEGISEARYGMPWLVYKSGRSEAQKDVIVKYQNAHSFIVDGNGNLIVENGKLLKV